LDVKDDFIEEFLSQKDLPTLDELCETYSRLQRLGLGYVEKNVRPALAENPLRGLSVMEKVLFDPLMNELSAAANAAAIKKIMAESEDERTRTKAQKVFLLVQRKVKPLD